MALSGKKLIRETLASTGLPQESLEKEFQRLLDSAGFSEESLTLEQLRELMVNYLQDTLLETREELNKSAS